MQVALARSRGSSRSARWHFRLAHSPASHWARSQRAALASTAMTKRSGWGEHPFTEDFRINPGGSNCIEREPGSSALPYEETTDRSAISGLLTFAVSVCLGMFALERLPSIAGLIQQLSQRYRDGVLASLGLYNLDLSAITWDVVVAVAGIFWLTKLSKSPVSQIFIAIVGASIGGWIGLHG